MSYKLLFLIALIFLFGCESTSSKRNELVSQAVYATDDSLKSKRYDLATKYSIETTKLVTPPKKRVPIIPIFIRKVDPETKKQIRENVVVLPEEAKGSVVRINSEEYKKLVEGRKADKKIIEAFTKSEESWKKYSERVEKNLKEALNKSENKIGVLDIIKYGIMGILAVPVIIILIVILWLISIVVRVIKSMVSKPTIQS